MGGGGGRWDGEGAAGVLVLLVLAIFLAIFDLAAGAFATVVSALVRVVFPAGLARRFDPRWAVLSLLPVEILKKWCKIHT